MQKMQMASTISSTTKPGMPASRASGSQGGVELLGVGGGELDGGGETEAARVTFGMVALGPRHTGSMTSRGGRGPA